MRRFPTAPLCASALLLGAAACSDDDDAGASDEPSSTTASDDSPTTLAKGEDIELDGTPGLGSQTLNISAEEEGGEVTGEFQISEVVTRVDCANADTDGIVILGGEVTTGAPGFIEVGELQALIIKEGDPDSVSLYANASGAESCTALVDSVPEDLLTDQSNFVDLEAGSDIETA